MTDAQGRALIGWREWLALPDLHVSRIKAKIDTGARSSSLHAHGIKIVQRGGRSLVRFRIHPVQRSSRGEIHAEADLFALRDVRNSGGQVERRPVIRTHVALAGRIWTIELTLTARDEMGFRMLLGRRDVRGQFLIHAGRSFLAGK